MNDELRTAVYGFPVPFQRGRALPVTKALLSISANTHYRCNVVIPDYDYDTKKIILLKMLTIDVFRTSQTGTTPSDTLRSISNQCKQFQYSDCVFQYSS